MSGRCASRSLQPHPEQTLRAGPYFAKATGRERSGDAALQLAGELRRLDPDRCLTVLAAPPPPPAAEPLLALYLLNAELARSAEVSRGPLLAGLRLKWWHDALADAAAGRPREQPVLQALAAPLADGRLPLAVVRR